MKINRFNDIFSRETKFTSSEAIDILKQLEYILTDEGCRVSYKMLNDFGISKHSSDFRVMIYTPHFVKSEIERSPLRYDNKTMYKFIDQFKQAEYFQEYIDRVFDEIPKNDFNILIMVDGTNLAYYISKGVLKEG